MIKNPLRYPGGKSGLAGYIYNVINCNNLSGCTMYEPYAGSASASFEMLDRDIIKQAILIERDPLIFSFWKSVFEHTEELCTKIEDTEINLVTWKEMSKLRDHNSPFGLPITDLGFACLFLNRTNFSGILKAGPIGGYEQKSEYKIDCRFNKNRVIDSIINISKFKDRVKIVLADAIEYMQNNIRTLNETQCFIYIDPPYYLQGKSLYRYYYEDESHKILANFIKGCHFPWLLSYDDHPYINDLYFLLDKGLNKQNLYLDYSARSSKKGAEVLISNLIIPPIISNEVLINDIAL